MAMTPRSGFHQRLAILGLAVAAALACSGQPAPLAARAGTSIVLAVGGDLNLGGSAAYGSTIYDDGGIYDDQRGKLRLQVDTSAVTGTPTLIDVRLATRLVADPATNLAINIDPQVLIGVAGLSTVVALVDLPASLEPGTWPIRFVRERPPGSTPVEFPFQHDLEVLPAAGENFTPLLAFYQFFGVHSIDAEADGTALDLYPWPRLVVDINSALGAAHLVLSYPNDRIEQILNVNDTLRVDQRGIIQMQDDPSATPTTGEVTIDIADPTGSMVSIGVVFKPKEPFVGPVAGADFALVEQQVYDIDGNAVASSITFRGIY
jgi:hypothetical protein